jgi:hypothetical protein
MTAKGAAVRRCDALSLAIPLLVCALYAPPASAGATVDLLFVRHNGDRIAATDTVAALPGDTLRMRLVLRNSSLLSIYAFSLAYDLDQPLDHLDPVVYGDPENPGFRSWAGVAMNPQNARFSPLLVPFNSTPTFFGSWVSTNGARTNAFLQVNNAPTIAGGYIVGTMTWKVKADLTPGSPAHIFSGLFSTGADGFADNNFNLIDDQVLFHGATVNAVPEPGTAVLLALGLVGLRLARPCRPRRSRSLS